MRMSEFTLREYPQEEYEANKPTTKNDLVVDCISRKAALDITWHDPSYSDPLNVLTEVRDKIRDLSSVTPIRPKGHWIWCVGSHKCSNCEEYTCFSDKELLRYCPNCGADMREVEE
jgi:hypothetical protein